MTSRPSAAAPLLAVTAILLAFLGAYVGGYYVLGEETLWLCEVELPPDTPEAPPKLVVQPAAFERAYPQLWLMLIYQPAGQVETWLRGTEVEISCSDAAP